MEQAQDAWLRGLVLPVLLLALTASGCQTLDDVSTTNTINTWKPAALARSDEGIRHAATGGTGIVDTTPAGKTTFLEGTGQFVGRPQAAGQPPAGDAGADGVTVNLVNVPAPQAAKTILGDMLAVKYTVDPGIEGKITIQTPKPVAKSAVVDLFQAALRANGAAITNTNGLYRIVALDQAAVGASIRIGGAPDAAERMGSGLQVVPLKYVSASEIRRILEPISPRGAIVRADDVRHTITLSGNREEMAGMLDAISLFDVDVMKGMSFALVPVKTSDPGAIADELRTVFASDHEGPMAGMVRFLPNKRLGAILVISAQPKYLDRAESWVRRLDAQAAGSEKQFFTYSVQNRRAQELVDVLQAMFSKETGGARAGTTGRNVAPNYQEASLQSSGAPTSSSSSAFPSSISSSSSSSSQPFGAGNSFGSGGGFAPASSPQPSGSVRASSQGSGPDASPAAPAGDDAASEPRIKIAADEAKNAILIEATAADYRRLMRVVGSLDVMPNQVMIEATIAEVTLTDELKFGLRWYLDGKKSSSTFTDDASGALGAVFPGFSYAVTAANVTATLNALNQITDVNVISSPSLTVMDNKTAFLQIGDEVPITTASSVSTLTSNSAIVNSVSYKDTGVILSITPRINESGRVLLDIEQEVSTVAATTTSGIDSPTIHQRRIRTSVVVNDGEGLALGGMIQDSRTVSHTQIPILGDIPVVGNAFKQKDNQMNKTELIIIITPHVVRNLNEARQVTDEFRRQMSIYAPRDYHRPRSLEENVRRTFE